MAKTGEPHGGEFDRLSILIVEDDPFARKALATALRAVQFPAPRFAANASEAINYLADPSVRLLITDVQLPGLSGIALLQAIRCGKTGARRDTRVMIHTSFAYRDVLGAAMALDANGFLLKPINASVLRHNIRQALTEPVHLRSALAYGAVNCHLSSIPSLDVSRNSPRVADGPMTDHDGSVSVGRSVAIDMLMAGMRVVEDVTTSNGALLLVAGHVLTQLQINRLADLSEVLANRTVRIEN